MLQGAIHGAEIIGSIAILNFLKTADPNGMRGKSSPCPSSTAPASNWASAHPR